MTRNSPRLSDDYTRRRHHHRQHQQHQQADQHQELEPQKPRGRPTSPHSHRIQSPHIPSSPHRLAHSGTRSSHSPVTHHSPRTLHKSSKPSSSSQNPHGPSPLKMVTTTAPVHPPLDDAQYYYLPDVDVPDEQHGGHAWTEPIVIDDEDLMFGGKSLSAWYEEERQSLSYPMEEHEERRGRQRMRQQHHPHHHHHQHHLHHHEQRHHHQPHHRISSSTKNVPGNNEQKRH
ncbi:hypothetical protein F5Y12DRAFT_231287 [Xylaria sp. FL1777]|nr:hypothetical protein F5Y12DRAFT_231287 [Xylaria sp. FL1777]